MNVRNEYKRRYLQSVLLNMTACPMYQAGREHHLDGSPYTYCNIAARDLLSSVVNNRVNTEGKCLSGMGYNLNVIAPIMTLRDIILNTSIQNYEQLCLDAVKNNALIELQVLDIYDAWNQGEAVHMVSGAKDHEAIVYNVDKLPNGVISIVVAQCGLKSGTFTLASPWAFGDCTIGKDVHAFVYPYPCEGGI